MSLLVTGGAGFIGGNLVRFLLERGYEVVNLDSLTYAGNLNSLDDVRSNPHYRFIQGDIRDAAALREIFAEQW